MEKKTINKEEMDALKQLVETNEKIGVARVALADLEKTETKFIEQREKKAEKAVEKILEKSFAVIEKAKKNYEDVQNFHNTVKSFADYLVEGQKKFTKLVDAFDSASEKWEEKVKKQENILSLTAKSLKEQENAIEKDKIEVEKAQKDIKNAQKKIADDEARLARIVERLKNNRI